MSKFKPGDTVIYMGGCQYSNGYGFKVGHKYEVMASGVGIMVISDTNKGIILMYDSNWPSVAYKHFKLDDDLGLSRIEPSPQCNCGAQHSPKGCSDWCNLIPEKKVS